EEHAGEQRRTLTDAVAEDLQHGHPGEQHAPDRSEDDPERTEEVQRTRGEPREELHGQEVEEPAKEPRAAELRRAVETRPVVHRDLADAVPGPMREHRDVA